MQLLPAATSLLVAGALLAPLLARAADVDQGDGRGSNPGVGAPPPALILLSAPGAERVEGLVALAAPAGTNAFEPELARALRAGHGALEGEAPGAWLATHEAALEVREGQGALRIEFTCPVGAAAAVLARVLELARTPELSTPPEDSASAASPALRRLASSLAGERAPGAGEDPPARAARWREVLRASPFAAGLSGPAALLEQRAALEALLAARAPSGGAPSAAPPLSDAPPGNYLLDRPSAHAEIGLLSAALPPESADGAALELAVEALGSGDSFEPLRIALAAEHGDAIALGARYARHPSRPAPALAWLRAPAVALGPALSATLERFGSGRLGLDEPALAKARAKLLANEPAYGDSARSELERAVLAALLGVAPQSFTEHARLLATIDARALRAALERAFDPSSRRLFALGPVEPLQPALARFDAPFSRLDPVSDELYDALFESLGGREAWRDAGCVELEVDHSPDGGTPVRLRVRRELDSPRMRVESEVGGLRSLFVLNETGAANRVGDELREFPDALHADLVERSWRDVHCLLHQLARAGPELVRALSARRLEIVRGPSSGLWIELGDDALPARAGTGETTLFLYSEWKAFGPLVGPARIRLEPSVWTREVLSLAATEAPEPELFELP